MLNKYLSLSKLEKKAIEEFKTFICKVLKGYRPDYEFIKQEISMIELIRDEELEDKLSLTALQYYLNNKWQMILF